MRTIEFKELLEKTKQHELQKIINKHIFGEINLTEKQLDKVIELKNAKAGREV